MYHQAKSLRSITLKVAFDDENNFREEPITFEVVPFKSTYHVIFGRPTFHSFLARPCYIYNQVKMPGPDGIITIYGSFSKAKECEEGEAAFTEAVFFSKEFKEIHAATDPAEMLASKQEVSASLHTFRTTVDTKQVELVTGDVAKTTSIETNCSPNKKARSSSSSKRTGTSLHGSHLTSKILPSHEKSNTKSWMVDCMVLCVNIFSKCCFLA
jgi:hypothetical protein